MAQGWEEGGNGWRKQSHHFCPGELRALEEAASEVNLQEKLHTVARGRAGEARTINPGFRRKALWFLVSGW